MLDLSLYLVTDSDLCASRSLSAIVEAAVQGGCTMVQLREKHLATGAFIARAREIKEVLRPYAVPLIINDRVDVALAAGADGVHLGQSDMSPMDARRILGPRAIIGLSIEQAEQVYEANFLPINYMAASPVFATSTKTDTAKPLGLDGARFVAASAHFPVVGIGGINHQTAALALSTGLKGIAVVSDIIASKDPEQSAHELKQIVQTSLNHSW